MITKNEINVYIYGTSGYGKQNVYPECFTYINVYSENDRQYYEAFKPNPYDISEQVIRVISLEPIDLDKIEYKWLFDMWDQDGNHWDESLHFIAKGKLTISQFLLLEFGETKISYQNSIC